MTEQTMIERVARALAKESGRVDPKAWKQYVNASRAAISAMREPTEAIRKAWVDAAPIGGAAVDRDWTFMIDAALAEG